MTQTGKNVKNLISGPISAHLAKICVRKKTFSEIYL